MTSSGRKHANWTNREDEKLLDILIEQRAQGAVKFEWSSLVATLKSEGIDKDAVQIKNHFYDLVKKLKAWEYLIGKIGVGVDCTIGAVIAPDDVWEDFLQKFGGKYKSFRTKAPLNLEKLKSAFYGRYATGKTSFASCMVASGSNLNQKLSLAVDAEEHMGDSDDGNDGGFANEVQCMSATESHSPPKSLHSSRKRKSGGGNSSDGKRQELSDCASRDDEINRALDILRMREEARQGPSLYKQVQARLKRHPVVFAMGSEFMFSVMDYIVKEKQEQYFVDLDDDLVLIYIQRRGFNI